MRTKQYLQFSLLLIVAFAIWRVPIIQTLSLALNDDRYTHILLIVPVSIAMIMLEHRKLDISSLEGKNLLSGILLVIALGIFVISKQFSPADIQLTISMAALVLWCIASFIFCFGLIAFRTFFFPACFLFWIVPWPQNFLDFAVGSLQQYSASTVYWMFQAAHIPVLRDGVVLSIPGLTIEVAKECSSIRSSLILLVSSMVLAQLFLRTKWRKAVVMLIAVPLSVIKNAIRIFVLALLGVHVNRGFLTGRLHRQGGAVFYAGALIVIFLLIYWLQKRENAPASTSRMATVTK